jgi:hypothetical protein
VQMWLVGATIVMAYKHPTTLAEEVMPTDSESFAIDIDEQASTKMDMVGQVRRLKRYFGPHWSYSMSGADRHYFFGRRRIGLALLFAWNLVGAFGQKGWADSKFFVPPAAAPGDYNNDGTVNPPDYDVWRTSFGSTTSLAADGNANSVIDAPDYVVWRAHLGSASAPVGNWSDPTLWSPAGLPGQFDSAIIHANRTANVTSDVGFVGEIRIGDTAAPSPTGGTVNINAGGKVTCLGQVLMGASNPGQYKEGDLNLNGGTLVGFGTMFIAFEPEATEAVNIKPGSLLDLHQDLYGRFGKATINQTGGTVNVQNNLIWGEGGDESGTFMSRSEYNISAGALNIGAALSIGGATANQRPVSNGRVNVTGGIVTAAKLIFDPATDEEAILNVAGSGLVQIKQANYSVAAANADIAGGHIIGNMLTVSTVSISGTAYTQIASSGLGASVVPEPGSCALMLLGGVSLLAGAGRNYRRQRAPVLLT